MERKGKLYWEAFRAVFAAKMMFWNAIVLPIGILMIWYRYDFVAYKSFIAMWVCTVIVIAYVVANEIVSKVDTRYELQVLAKKARELCWYMTAPYLLILFVISTPALLVYGVSGMLIARANAKNRS